MPYDLAFLARGGTVADLLEAYRAESVSARDVVRFFLGRIERYNPQLRAVLAVNPSALERADELDRSGDRSLPLFGVPMLVKDNIETADQPTTAGSTALARDTTGRDAPVVTALRNAGAVILGKSNLSTWANFQTSRSVSGWSDVGGQCVNPHNTAYNPSGSSSGSAVGVAAGLCLAAIGTETSGSIVSPASINGVVGLKPTVGRVSAEHIVPISHTQDTAGPLTRCVADAMLVDAVLSGDTDLITPSDELRLGAFIPQGRHAEAVDALLRSTFARLQSIGTLLQVDAPDDASFAEHHFARLLHEFKADLNTYLASRPGSAPKSLAELIEYNNRHPGELAHLGQDVFEQAELTEGLAAPAYLESHNLLNEKAGAALTDALDSDDLDALITITNGPSWPIDHESGDERGTSGWATLPAISGYPHLTIPMGLVDGMPVGLSLIGRRGADRALLAAGVRVEAALGHRALPNDFTDPNG